MNHSEMVATLAKNEVEIADSINPFKCGLMHMIMGISGEAGELLDAIKKYIIYEKDLDRQNVVEELGDIEFYLEGFRQILKISREETLQHNMDKLINKTNSRYAEGKYSNQQAQFRADKK